MKNVAKIIVGLWTTEWFCNIIFFLTEEKSKLRYCEFKKNNNDQIYYLKMIQQFWFMTWKCKVLI